MTVTRDVILDLWPLYQGGELSADSRALVDRFLASDPEFAGVLRRAGDAAGRVIGGPPAGTAPERGMVQATRRRLAHQRWLTGAAVLATLIPFTAVIDFGAQGGVRLLVREWPMLWISLPIGLILWVWLWRLTKSA